MYQPSTPAVAAQQAAHELAAACAPPRSRRTASRRRPRRSRRAPAPRRRPRPDARSARWRSAPRPRRRDRRGGPRDRRVRERRAARIPAAPGAAIARMPLRSIRRPPTARAGRSRRVQTTDCGCSAWPPSRTHISCTTSVPPSVIVRSCGPAEVVAQQLRPDRQPALGGVADELARAAHAHRAPVEAQPAHVRADEAEHASRRPPRRRARGSRGRPTAGRAGCARSRRPIPAAPGAHPSASRARRGRRPAADRRARPAGSRSCARASAGAAVTPRCDTRVSYAIQQGTGG